MSLPSHLWTEKPFLHSKKQAGALERETLLLIWNPLSAQGWLFPRGAQSISVAPGAISPTVPAM